MKHIGHEVILFITISALVFIFAFACGTPFVVNAESPSHVVAQQQRAQAAVFQGTVLRNGERFSIRTAAGQIYQLDDPQHVQPYEGKNVRITGTLDSSARLIHVSRIEVV